MGTIYLAKTPKSIGAPPRALSVQFLHTRLRVARARQEFTWERMKNNKRESLEFDLSSSRTIEQEVWLLAQPFDITDLVGEGILKRNGDWYEVPNPHDLPEHVIVKVRDVKSEGGKVHVQLPCSVKASQLIAECMGIDWRGPKPI